MSSPPADGHESPLPLDLDLPPSHQPVTLLSIERYISDLAALIASPLAVALVGRHLNRAACVELDPTLLGGLSDVWTWYSSLGSDLDDDKELEERRAGVLKALTRGGGGDLEEQVSSALRALVPAKC